MPVFEPGGQEPIGPKLRYYHTTECFDSLPVHVGRGLVQQGVVLAHKLPSHALGTRRDIHDHRTSLHKSVAALTASPS